MRALLRWAGLLAVSSFIGWRMLAVLLLLLLAAWLPTSDLVDANRAVGYFLDSPALMMTSRSEIELGILGGFLLVTPDLLSRTVSSGSAAYAAASMRSRARWWVGTALAIVLAAVTYWVLTMAICLAVGVLRLGMTSHPGPARARVLAGLNLPEWTTQPSPMQLTAMLLPLLLALIVVGLVPSVVALWTTSTVLPGVPVAVGLLGSLMASGALWPFDLFGATNIGLYRRYVFPDGTVWPGVSLTVAVVVGLGWLLVIFLVGWLRVRLRGMPLAG